MSTALAAVLALVAAPVPAAVDDRSQKEAFKHYRAGQSALQSERWAEAEAEFRLALGLDPLFVAAHYGLGQTMMATKRYPDAVGAFSRAEAAFRRQQAEGATDRLAVQKRLDEHIKALEDDVNAARRLVSGPNATRVQAAIDRNEEQIKTLQSLRRRDEPGPLPTPHWLSFALGSAYFRSGDIAKAEQEYRAALAQKPDLGEGHLNLGVVCMLTGRLDEAESEIALAEKAGIRIPRGLREDLKKRWDSRP
jgi:tetratricopeptide (TPR) repeat protein